LAAAGFTDLRIAVLSLSKIVPDVATYAQALVRGNPLIDQIRARGGVDPEQVIDSLTKHRRGGLRQLDHDAGGSRSIRRDAVRDYDETRQLREGPGEGRYRAA
jgi:hypothetical protein